jgi:hypothetical protein
VRSLFLEYAQMQPTRKAQRKVLESQALPHSWSLFNWPSWVYPSNPTAARRLLTKYRAELIAAGALTRIDRRLTVLGAGFAVFLASKMVNVPGYRIPPNHSRVEREVTA